MLADLIAPNLRLLFVGYNPSLRSAELGHHFAGRSNGFWKVLHQASLTPQRMTPQQDAEILALGFGLTNLVDRPTRAAAELTSADYQLGREQLRQKLELYRPGAVCYVGIGVYKIFARRSQCSFGWQPESVVPGVADFVAPSTSGLNRMPYAEQLAIYRQLAAGLEQRQVAGISPATTPEEG